MSCGQIYRHAHAHRSPKLVHLDYKSNSLLSQIEMSGIRCESRLEMVRDLQCNLVAVMMLFIII